MIKNSNPWFIVAVLVVFTSCCSSSGQLSGTFEGPMKLSKVFYGSDNSDTYMSGSGKVSFPHRDTIRFGAETPLPDCNLSLTETADREYLITSATQYKGESNDGSGCTAVILAGVEVPVTVEGVVRREAGGEISVKALFYRRNDPDLGQFELQFRGRKTGWF